MSGIRNPADIIHMMAKLSHEEGCVTIQPYPEQFRPFERDFLEGVRRIPARISSPPGVNPYAFALNRPGRWLFVWVPEE